MVKNKLNLIVQNFEVYSKAHLKMPFYLVKNRFKLLHLLRKGFKMLEPILQLKKSGLSYNIQAASYIDVEIEGSFFLLVLKNICLLIEKHGLESGIEIKLVEEIKSVELEVTISNAQFLSNKDNLHLGSGVQTLNIFNMNNRTISELAGFGYSEIEDREEKVIKYTLCLSNLIKNNANIVSQVGSVPVLLFEDFEKSEGSKGDYDHCKFKKKQQKEELEVQISNYKDIN